MSKKLNGNLKKTKIRYIYTYRGRTWKQSGIQKKVFLLRSPFKKAFSRIGVYSGASIFGKPKRVPQYKLASGWKAALNIWGYQNGTLNPEPQPSTGNYPYAFCFPGFQGLLHILLSPAKYSTILGLRALAQSPKPKA